MRIIAAFSMVILILLHGYVKAQVKTSLNNRNTIGPAGKFNKKYKEFVYDINPPDTNAIRTRDTAAHNSNIGKPFRFAEPISVNIDVVESAQWVEESGISYGKLSVRVRSAKSLSVNFNNFFLPDGTEMFIYNRAGKMITGPVTESENNINRVWGTSVYLGDELTIELRLATASKSSLKLNVSNVAFGYKEIYGFGNSSSCNINVVCSLGSGWEQERNSVALILNDDGSTWCSGSLVTNACNFTTPYFLTANHCIAGQDVTKWRFVFQFWSSTCLPDEDDLSNLLFNGSVLRANSAGSDFALLELSQTPHSSSGISYAGWSRETTGVLQTTIIHHPAGDVMKISRDNDVPVFAGLSGQYWQLVIDLGATDGGSSGAPYFNQNHRIIGQHYGINQNNQDQCLNTNKFGGRFDFSWVGGGTNATRLSNWLDPTGTGIMNTNTTNVADLIPTPPAGLIISGADSICSAETYTVNVPLSTTISLKAVSAPKPNLISYTTTGNQITVNRNGTSVGTVAITATITTNCGTFTVSRNVFLGPVPPTIIGPYDPIEHTIMGVACTGQQYYFVATPFDPTATYTWTLIPPLGSQEPTYLFSGSQPYMTFTEIGCYTLQVSKTNSCGTVTTERQICAQECYSAFRLAASPNPASNQINATIDEEKKEVKSFDADTDIKFEIFGFNNGVKQKQWTFKYTQRQFALSLDGISKGIYVLKATKGKYTQSIKIFVN